MASVSTTRVFDHFEADYLSHTRTAAQALERLGELIPGVEKDKVSQAAAKSLEAADDIVQQMELEARSTQGETKAQLLAQAKDYKAGIALLRSKLKAAKISSTTQAAEQARAELFASADPARWPCFPWQRRAALPAHPRMRARACRLRVCPAARNITVG